MDDNFVLKSYSFINEERSAIYDIDCLRNGKACILKSVFDEKQRCFVESEIGIYDKEVVQRLLKEENLRNLHVIYED